jgi:hypothetical protein
LDYSDYYSFGGQRLILKSGEYGKDGAEYVTEKYSNMKIKSVGAISGQQWQGPEYWEVTFSDGAQAWYGATASGNSSARTPIDYNIVKSKDINGNYITYNYVSDGNVSVINSIQWGGNESQNTQHFNKIEFVFGTRPRSETAYIKGIGFSQSKLLESIIVSTADSQYKKYNVTYKKDLQGTTYRYLDKITVLNSKNEASNPVIFTYEKSGQSDSIPSTVSTSLRPNKDNDVVGDFDGDGNLDLLRYHSTTSARIPQSGLYLYKDFYSITYNTETPVFINSSLQGLKDAIAVNLKKNNLIHNRQGFVVQKKIPIPSSSKSDLELSFYSISENNQLNLDTQKTIPGISWDETSGTSQNGTKTTIKGLSGVDFNGDGLSELVLRLNDEVCSPIPVHSSGKLPFECKDYMRYYVIDPDGSIQNNGWFYPLALHPDFDKRDKDAFIVYRGGDFNGDGIFDLLKLDENKKPQLITFRKNNQGQYESALSPFNPAGSEILEGAWEMSVAGDYNGDGLSDIMMPETSTSGFWNKYTSKGNGFNKERIEFEAPMQRKIYQNGPNVSIENPKTFFAYDLNNDGKSELLSLQSQRRYGLTDLQDNNNSARYNTVSEVRTMVYSTTGGYGTMESSNAHGIYLEADRYIVYLNDSNIGAEMAVNSRDLMGISVDQWTGAMQRTAALGSAIGWGSDVGDVQRTVSHQYYDIAKAGRIKSISQGGITTDITYKQLDKKINPGLYDGSATVNYPYVEISQSTGIYVVSQLTQSTTTPNKNLKQDFRYRGLTSNILGRGMIGFRKSARSSWYADGFENTKIWSGVEIDPLNEGVPVKDWSIRTNDETNIFPADVSENNTKLLSFKSTTYQIDKLLNGQVVATVADADKPKIVTAIVPKTTKGKDFLTGATAENTVDYGEFYLPVKSTSKVNTSYATTTSAYEYNNNAAGTGANYYIGLPKSKTETAQAYGDTKSGKEEYTYENNRLKTVKK